MCCVPAKNDAHESKIVGTDIPIHLFETATYRLCVNHKCTMFSHYQLNIATI